MAYLSPKTPVCAACGHTGPLVWITGVPLEDAPRAGRGYVRVHKSGDWHVEKTEGETVVCCPSCSTEVARRSLKP